VKKIVSRRRNLEEDSQVEFEVKWKGFEDYTWDPEE
jgi:hypothetical protein